MFDRKVIILDEPTASFSASEIDNLLEIVHKIKARGMGIIYISHHLDEVFKIADKITVLRDGQYIKTIGVGETDEPHLIRDMVGRDASAFYSREFYPKGETVLEVSNLTGNGVKNVSFKLNRGEIVGFAGMVGSGRSELMTLLFGGAEKLTGKVKVLGKEVNFKNPSDAIKHKMCYITEDRQHTGLFLIHTIARNTLIANMVNTKGSYINPKQEMKVGDEFVKKLGTKAKDASVLAGNLSGGEPAEGSSCEMVQHGWGNLHFRRTDPRHRRRREAGNLSDHDGPLKAGQSDYHGFLGYAGGRFHERPRYGHESRGVGRRA